MSFMRTMMRTPTPETMMLTKLTISKDHVKEDLVEEEELEDEDFFLQ